MDRDDFMDRIIHWGGSAAAQRRRSSLPSYHPYGCRRSCTSCTRGNIQLTPYVQAKLHELQAEERAARGGGLCGGGEGGGEGGGALGLGAASYQAQLRREARATLRERLLSTR